MQPFTVASAQERRAAELFYTDLMGSTPPRAGRGSERRRAELFYVDLMGSPPAGTEQESVVPTEDAAEDRSKQDLRDRTIGKARDKKTFLSEATVRTAIDERAPGTDLAQLFDNGVAAAAPSRRRSDALGADWIEQLTMYWGLVDAYAQRIIDLLERDWVRDWTQAMPMATATKPGKRKKGVLAAQGPLSNFKIDTGTDAKGMPTFSYRTDVGAFTDTDDNAFPKARKAAAQVQAARDRVRKTMMRTFVRINESTKAGLMAGFERSTRVLAMSSVQDPPSQAEKDADKDYAEWLKKAKMSSDLAAFSGFEGDPASMQGSDKANLTWGPGIAASGGALQRLMKDVIDKSPDAKQAFFDVGISMVAQQETERWDFQFAVVDTEKKWILVSTDAELFIRSRPELLTMFVNIAQGYTNDLTSPSDSLRKIYLEAISARVPKSSKVWKNNVAKLMAKRGIHSGQFGWDDFNENMTLEEVRAILRTKLPQQLVDQIQASVSGTKPK